MRLHDIKNNAGARKSRKRIGCGESSGHGKTSGRGHKGQRARSGGAVRPGFEGGQMPMHRRLPKKGFNNSAFRDKVAIINVGDLESFDEGSMITNNSLIEAGLVSGRFDYVKILGNGELTKKLTITLANISAGAKEKIEKAGGVIASAS
jgi:large subunit ribosomal protein L15